MPESGLKYLKNSQVSWNHFKRAETVESWRVKEATVVYKERSRWTASAFQTLERCATALRSTSNSIIFRQRAEQSPNVGTEVKYYPI